jgi:hypothetical protein
MANWRRVKSNLAQDWKHGKLGHFPSITRPVEMRACIGAARRILVMARPSATVQGATGSRHFLSAQERKNDHKMSMHTLLQRN